MSRPYSFAIEARSASARNWVGQFFAQPNDVIARPHIVDLFPFGTLGLEKPVDPVKSDPPVVPNDTAAAVSIGQAGDDP
jgi:hypothetical protein